MKSLSHFAIDFKHASTLVIRFRKGSDNGLGIINRVDLRPKYRVCCIDLAGVDQGFAIEAQLSALPTFLIKILRVGDIIKDPSSTSS